ncbi:pentapeptide repeat-containing protein [Trichocoleus desertorum AS-A10]|uniref:pentapeptide repeat-containing protein n=1 Tax=Trichocoleus desertorum TaxID=1481672 RepID=UPI00329959BD
MPDSEAESLKQWLIALALIFLSVALVIGFTLWTIEVTSIEQIQHSSEPLAGKSLLELKNQGIKSVLDALKTVAAAFGGVAILFNVFYAAKRVESMDRAAIAAEKNIEVGLKNVEIGLKNAVLTEERLITERFAKAIELLGSKETEIRIGGIYALERIANDSPKDYWQIIEVLAAYVRERAPWPPKPSSEIEETITDSENYKVPTDIQATLSVLGRRKHSYGLPEEPYSIDLEKTNLRGVTLNSDTKFQKANFSKANLQEAKLLGTKLQEAFFINADLRGAYVINAQLQQANCMSTDFRGANVFNSNLQEANLMNTNLKGARFTQANLQQANLASASCQNLYSLGSNFQEANLQKANLQEAILAANNFTGTLF